MYYRISKSISNLLNSYDIQILFIENKIPMPLGFTSASGTPCILHGPVICKGIVPVISDDDVIQNIYIKHHPAIPELLGQLAISFTGLCIP